MKPISKFLNEAINGFQRTTPADVRKMNKSKVGKKMKTMAGDSFEFVAAYHMADGFDGFKKFYKYHKGDKPWMLTPGELTANDVVVALKDKKGEEHLMVYCSAIYFV